VKTCEIHIFIINPSLLNIRIALQQS